MKTKLILITILLLLSTNTYAGDWSKTDRGLFTYYLIASVADIAVTSNLDKEYNPILQDRDGSPDMAKVVGVKILAAGLLYLIADRSPDKVRPVILTVAGVIQTGIVVYNWR